MRTTFSLKIAIQMAAGWRSDTLSQLSIAVDPNSKLAALVFGSPASLRIYYQSLGGALIVEYCGN